MDTQGFVGFITQGGQFPQSNFGGFGIKPGHKNSFALTATLIHSDPELLQMNAWSRNCFYEWENSFLRIFKKYTHQNCIFECSLFYAQNMLRHKFQPCSPWYFPSDEQSPNICDPWQVVL
jgi:hypothetical protein